MANHIHKKFGDLTIDYAEVGDERDCFVNYGPARGSQTFGSLRAALYELDKWSDKEINDLSKQLAAIAKLRRYIRSNAILSIIDDKENPNVNPQ